MSVYISTNRSVEMAIHSIENVFGCIYNHKRHFSIYREDIQIKDKRSKKRIKFKEALKFGEYSADYDGMSQDLSPNGISIVSDKALPMNSNIIIQFNGALRDITLEGKVVWVSSPPGLDTIMGIMFTRSSMELENIYNIKLKYHS